MYFTPYITRPHAGTFVLCFNINKPFPRLFRFIFSYFYFLWNIPPPPPHIQRVQSWQKLKCNTEKRKIKMRRKKFATFAMLAMPKIWIQLQNETKKKLFIQYCCSTVQQDGFEPTKQLLGPSYSLLKLHVSYIFSPNDSKLMKEWVTHLAKTAERLILCVY